jgi:hypothetical protein
MPCSDFCALSKDKETGLPLIRCNHAASPEEELKPERVEEILLAQEVGWREPLADSNV